jgi:hypothetical protein
MRYRLAQGVKKMGARRVAVVEREKRIALRTGQMEEL